MNPIASTFATVGVKEEAPLTASGRRRRSVAPLHQPAGDLNLRARGNVLLRA